MPPLDRAGAQGREGGTPKLHCNAQQTWLETASQLSSNPSRVQEEPRPSPLQRGVPAGRPLRGAPGTASGKRLQSLRQGLANSHLALMPGVARAVSQNMHGGTCYGAQDLAVPLPSALSSCRPQDSPTWFRSFPQGPPPHACLSSLFRALKQHLPERQKQSPSSMVHLITWCRGEEVVGQSLCKACQPK